MSEKKEIIEKVSGLCEAVLKQIEIDVESDTDDAINEIFEILQIEGILDFEEDPHYEILLKCTHKEQVYYAMGHINGFDWRTLEIPSFAKK